MFSSNKTDWETPDDFFLELDKKYGFTLDVAANAENKKCARYFSADDDGLQQSWKTDGAVWCNPPYGRQIKDWVKKASDEAKLIDNTIVMLIPARTDTSYFHDYIYGTAEIYFVRGRIKFLDNKKEKSSAPFPSMIVVWNKQKSHVGAVDV